MSSEDDPEIFRDMPENLDDLTFEQWCELHESDPHRFDACRLKMLNDVIDSAPEASKPRLRGLMFRMEGEARRSKSPLGYSLRLSSMMMEMLEQMRERMFELCESDASKMEDRLQPKSAKVLPFNQTDKIDDPQ